MKTKPKTLPANPLPANIREARLAAGLSQEAAAAKCGVAHNTWSRWEQGRQSPTLDYMRRIAETLGTTAAALVG